MTRLTFVYTSNNGTSIEMTSYAQALERVKKFGGSFVSKYIEGKDVDYIAPNPNTKRFAQRLCARG